MRLNPKAKTAGAYAAVALIAVAAALNYQIFIFPNVFAPSGIDGLCTMVRYLFHIDFGFLSLLCNIPLLVCSYFLLSHDFTFKTAWYVLVFSLANTFFGQIDLSAVQYHTATGTSVVLAPIAAGVIRGVFYSLTHKVDATSGGTEIIAALIRRNHADFNFMSIVLMLNGAVALLSYFVYSFQVEPVICSILYSYLSASVSGRFSQWARGFRAASQSKEKADVDTIVSE